jgi:hypothetical protein
LTADQVAVKIGKSIKKPVSGCQRKRRASEMKRGITKFLEACYITGTILIGLAFIAFIAYLIALGIASFIKGVRLRPADLPAATPSEGVAWIMPESGEAAVWLSPVCADEAETARLLEEYTEGESPVPAWWNPGEPMAAEWSAEDINVPCNKLAINLQPDTVDYNAPEGIDPGGIDWNICTELIGWDGHRAEAWELDLMARVFYLEFWGTSLPCSEAGCDAILNLWDTGKYGRTLFDALSYYDPKYGYTYRVYPKVWQTDYNPEGLAWCREFCEERFLNGPEWECVYFQLGGYHDTDWVPPLYEMDGVYFSGANEG